MLQAGPNFFNIKKNVKATQTFLKKWVIDLIIFNKLN
jgi:hypothetical protein